jgi:hypothetical protein
MTPQEEHDKPIDKKGAEEDLKAIKKVFDHYGVKFFLAYGTLLGAVRDKDFITWDDDMDIGIVEPIDFKTRKLIGWSLFDLGFRAQDIMFNVFGRWEVAEQGYNGDAETGIMVLKRKERISIFWYKDDGKEYVITPRPGGQPLLATPYQFYKKYDTVKFKGEKWLAPSPINDYLTQVYGDWKIPVQGKHADQYFITNSENKDMVKDVLSKNSAIFPNGKP